MSEIAVTCEVSCQLCGWNTGATIIADEANLSNEILLFLSRCLQQNEHQRTSGKLLVTWKQLEPVAQ
jgi:hypothetical protein